MSRQTENILVVATATCAAACIALLSVGLIHGAVL